MMVMPSLFILINGITFLTDTAGELNILGHDCYTLGMDGTQVGVLKETNMVVLSSLNDILHFIVVLDM